MKLNIACITLSYKQHWHPLMPVLFLYCIDYAGVVFLMCFNDVFVIGCTTMLCLSYCLHAVEAQIFNISQWNRMSDKRTDEKVCSTGFMF